MTAYTQPPFIEALKATRPKTLPIWFMRQAGRSLPEYRTIRDNVAMLDACLDPEVAAEITCQPVRRHKVDAAIFFSDIVVPLKLAGVDVDIVPGKGPVFGQPLKTADDVKALVEHEIDDLYAITSGVQQAVMELGIPGGDEPWTPLIAFAGAPFTMAAYLVDGKPTRDHLGARAMMHADPQSWDTLMDWCATLASQFIVAQLQGGAKAVQLFDSWAGSLSRDDYQKNCAPFSGLVLDTAHAHGAPTIHFGTGTGEILDIMRDCGAECIGVDHRITLAQAVKRVSHGMGDSICVQGNIDPAILTCPWSVIERHVDSVLRSGQQAAAHIVNLGHGVPPNTDPEVLTRIVEYVHAWQG
ncbi:MAG: uroporphyrinogen decarboxylase [Actinomycetaceae bacterium]|nr:uroporphyrinogen decarboxylase [Actinomycetaceae bacterium]